MGSLLCRSPQEKGPRLAFDHPVLAARCYPRSGNSAGDVVGAESLAEESIQVVDVRSDSGDRLVCAWADFSEDKNAVGRRRVLLYFHGNGELAWQSAAMWAKEYHMTMGVDACFFAEYRGYGASEGRACLCEMQRDLPAMMEAVVSCAGGPVKELFVYGRSIGSISALSFAAQHPTAVTGLILESGIAKIQEWVLWYASRGKAGDGGGEFLRSLGLDPGEAKACAEEHLNTAARLKTYTGPLLTLHTRGDIIVPPEHAEEFERLAKSVESRAINRLVIWSEGGHNDIHFKNERAYLQELRDFAASASAPSS